MGKSWRVFNMGYGPIVNGKQTPITPYKGSWAEQVNKPKETSNEQSGVPLLA